MLSGLFGRRPNRTTDATYVAIVAQARRPVFYTGFGVADTVKGRFDVIVAHMVVFCGRFGATEAPSGGPDGPPKHAAAMQAVLDRFFLDMEDNLREMGVTDTGVPKQMKGLASVWLGRVSAYGPPLAAGDAGALAAALARNVFGAETTAPPLGAAALARYMIAARDALAATAIDPIIAGAAPWPDPADYAPDAATPATGAREEHQP